MATGVLDIVNVLDSAAAADDDDEISVLYATPVSVKKGTSKFDAIPVESYPIRRKMVIDLSEDPSYFDDEIKILHSFPQTRKRVFRGESSNSKPAKDTKSSTAPLSFVCEICADEKPVINLFRILGCNHFYCSECISKYVASKLQENITTINCPVPHCKGLLEPQHCRSIIPKQVFDRWGDALCEAVILGSEKFYCPFKDCSALLIDERRVGNEIITQSECPDCNRLFCAQCKVPWHAGMACAEFQTLKAEDRSNEDIMLMNLAKSQKWMRCAKCQFFVEKTEGCVFMRCRCGYCFCYNCGAKLVEHFCRKCKR